jgi:hypothetical protein
MRVGLQLPTAVVGVDVNDWSPIRVRYEEMFELVVANGESAHAFDAVMRTPASDVGLEN